MAVKKSHRGSIHGAIVYIRAALPVRCRQPKDGSSPNFWVPLRACGANWTGVASRSHLCQDRDRIANLSNRHGGAIRYEPDFHTHFDPLIFIVPVGLDGMDIDRELPRRGL